VLRRCSSASIITRGTRWCNLTKLALFDDHVAMLLVRGNLLASSLYAVGLPVWDKLKSRPGSD
jgi:hypothetical protein